jgi:hypothetical protein
MYIQGTRRADIKNKEKSSFLPTQSSFPISGRLDDDPNVWSNPDHFIPDRFLITARPQQPSADRYCP